MVTTLKVFVHIFILIACTRLITGETVNDMKQAFNRFELNYKKKYSSLQEHAHAFECFVRNMKLIERHTKNSPLATFDINEFSDMCYEEFREVKLGAKFKPASTAQTNLQPEQLRAALEIMETNQEVDWRKKGAVNAVKNQGQCGSCWAFGTVANIESQSFLWGGKGDAGTLRSLSEQDLVSCDHFKDNTGSDQGCKGGWPDRALTWISEGKGLPTESTYPYTSGGGQNGDCDTSKQSPIALVNNVIGHQDLASNETYIAAYVAKYGPVVIGVQATSAWQQYSGGILTASCSSRATDHAVVIVGYGSDSGTDYWIIRNSWAAKWGEEGYIRLQRGVNCNGVASHVSSALFQNRSLCLAKCASGSSCCGGDCCDLNDGKSKCCTDGTTGGKKTGCCTAPATCCGTNGGGACCDDPKKCCGGVCCDGICSPDGSSCCPKDQLCGGECCATNTGGGKCCKGKYPSCTKSITDQCCNDGTACKIMTTCCPNPQTGKSTCCPFMSHCDGQGSCTKGGVDLKQAFINDVVFGKMKAMAGRK